MEMVEIVIKAFQNWIDKLIKLVGDYSIELWLLVLAEILVILYVQYMPHRPVIRFLIGTWRRVYRWIQNNWIPFVYFYFGIQFLILIYLMYESWDFKADDTFSKKILVLGESFLKFIAGFTAINLLAIFLLSLFKELINTQILLEPFEVPKCLIEKGYSSAVLNNLYKYQIEKIITKSKVESAKKITQALEAKALDVKIPQVGLSLKSLVEQIRKIMPFIPQPTKIVNQILVQNEVYTLITKIEKKNKTFSPFTIPNQESIETFKIEPLFKFNNHHSKIEDLLFQSVLYVYEKIDPCALSIYYFNQKELEKSIKLLSKTNFETNKDKKRGLILEYFFKLTNDKDKSLKENILKKLKKFKLVEYNSLIYNNLGNIYSLCDDQDQAIVCFKKAITLSPYFAITYKNMGNVYYNKAILEKDKESYFNKAIEYYQKALEINPEYAGAYNNLGTTYSDIQDYDQAIDFYNKALEINPEHALAYNNLGNAYSNKKEYDQAIVCYNKALEINPEYASAYYNLGTAYSDKKEYDHAIDSYNKALEINPEYASVYYNLGNAYSDKKDYDHAIDSYNKALEINPEYADVYINMGIAYNNKEEYDQAIDCFNKALEINPEFVEAYNNMGIVYKNKKEYDQAINCYNKALKINPHYANAYFNMGLAYKNKKDYDQAIDCYKKALKINPEFVEAYNNMGIVYKNKKEYVQAIDSYNKALEINPEHSSAYYNLGRAYSDIKDYDQAIDCYTKALKINSKYINAYFKRSLAYNAIGELEKAKVDFKKYLELTQTENEKGEENEES